MKAIDNRHIFKILLVLMFFECLGLFLDYRSELDRSELRSQQEARARIQQIVIRAEWLALSEEARRIVADNWKAAGYEGSPEQK